MSGFGPEPGYRVKPATMEKDREWPAGCERHPAGHSLLAGTIRMGGRQLGYIEIEEERCKGCELCGEACPRHLIHLSSARINRLGYRPAEFGQEEVNGRGKGCTGCAVCALVCPETAIAVYR